MSRYEPSVEDRLAGTAPELWVEPGRYVRVLGGYRARMIVVYTLLAASLLIRWVGWYTSDWTYGMLMSRATTSAEAFSWGALAATLCLALAVMLVPALGYRAIIAAGLTQLTRPLGELVEGRLGSDPSADSGFLGLSASEAYGLATAALATVYLLSWLIVRQRSARSFLVLIPAFVLALPLMWAESGMQQRLWGMPTDLLYIQLVAIGFIGLAWLARTISARDQRPRY